jgi:hypothetical protein
MRPQKGRTRCRLDDTAVKVPSACRDDEARDQAEEHTGRLHEGRSKDLADDDDGETREAETEILRRAPWMRAGTRAANEGVIGRACS